MGHNRNIEPPKTFPWTCNINMKSNVSFDSHLRKLFNQYNDDTPHLEDLFDLETYRPPRDETRLQDFQQCETQTLATETK